MSKELGDLQKNSLEPWLSSYWFVVYLIPSILVFVRPADVTTGLPLGVTHACCASCHSLRFLWPNCVWSLWSESESEYRITTAGLEGIIWPTLRKISFALGHENFHGLPIHRKVGSAEMISFWLKTEHTDKASTRKQTTTHHVCSFCIVRFFSPSLMAWEKSEGF